MYEGCGCREPALLEPQSLTKVPQVDGPVVGCAPDHAVDFDQAVKPAAIEPPATTALHRPTS